MRGLASLPTAAALGAAALVAATLLGCPARDPCADTPACQDLDATHQQTVNCEPSCGKGPCSNGPQFHACGADTTCTQVGARPGSAVAFRDRAICLVTGSDACDPDLAGPPTCDGLGTVRGCSDYGKVIEAACAQAQLFFRDAACCALPFDGGTSHPDAGADAGDGGS